VCINNSVYYLFSYMLMIIKLISELGSSVSIVSGYSWTIGRSRFDPQKRRKDFSSSFCVHIGSGSHPSSCTMGTGGPFPGDKGQPGG
jgi:hypothetical protein